MVDRAQEFVDVGPIGEFVPVDPFLDYEQLFVPDPVLRPVDLLLEFFEVQGQRISGTEFPE